VKNTLIEAVLIVVVVIFLFLASFRSVVIPVVTIPLSPIGVCSLMLVMGFSFNLDAVGDGAGDRPSGRRRIVVVENIHRHLEEERHRSRRRCKAREIVGPVISMTITLAAVYAPIGFFMA
jgi:multidrug efflux pump